MQTAVARFAHLRNDPALALGCLRADNLRYSCRMAGKRPLVGRESLRGPTAVPACGAWRTTHVGSQNSISHGSLPPTAEQPSGETPPTYAFSEKDSRATRYTTPFFPAYRHHSEGLGNQNRREFAHLTPQRGANTANNTVCYGLRVHIGWPIGGERASTAIEQPRPIGPETEPPRGGLKKRWPHAATVGRTSRQSNLLGPAFRTVSRGRISPSKELSGVVGETASPGRRSSKTNYVFCRFLQKRAPAPRRGDSAPTIGPREASAARSRRSCISLRSGGPALCPGAAARDPGHANLDRFRRAEQHGSACSL